MQKIFEAKGEIIHSGTHPGLPNQQVPLWADSNNIVFRDNAAKVVGAHQPLFAPLVSATQCTGILALNNAGAPALVWGDDHALYLGLLAPTTIDVTRLSGGYGGIEGDTWSFVQFGNSILATNGRDAPQYLADFTVDVNFVDLYTLANGLDIDFRCKIFAGTGAYVIAFNTNNANYEYRWCTEDDILEWTPLATNSARDIQLRELESDIVAVSELGDLEVIFGRDQIHAIAYRGAPFFFPSQHLMNGIGAIGTQSVVTVGRMVYGMDSHGIYVMDGTSFQYVDSPAIHSYLFEQTLDTTRISDTTFWADQNEEMIYCSYPHLTDGGKTVGFNYKAGTWSLFEWYRTAASSGGLWGYPVMGDQDGGIWGQAATSTGVVTEGRPLLMKDELTTQFGYGHGGYGRGGYGGRSVQKAG